jgi:hypothetical protein
LLAALLFLFLFLDFLCLEVVHVGVLFVKLVGHLGELHLILVMALLVLALCIIQSDSLTSRRWRQAASYAEVVSSMPLPIFFPSFIKLNFII